MNGVCIDYGHDRVHLYNLHFMCAVESVCVHVCMLFCCVWAYMHSKPLCLHITTVALFVSDFGTATVLPKTLTSQRSCSSSVLR